MLFTGADNQDQAVVMLEVGFDIHPVEIFDTHNLTPKREENIKHEGTQST
jgi:hypothetical protein